jgi:thiol:disulfide interchange protein
VTDGPKPGKWMHQALAAATTLVVVAVAARLVWLLTEPLLPLLLLGLGLLTVFGVVLGKFRR